MNWFTDKLYDLGASPRAGEAAWGELAAQDAMSPATRASYYAGSEMPQDPRAQGWAPDAEKTFQAGIRATPWFAEFKQKFGEEPRGPGQDTARECQGDDRSRAAPDEPGRD